MGTWHNENNLYGQKESAENLRISQTKQGQDYQKSNLTLTKTLLTTNEIIASEATNIF